MKKALWFLAFAAFLAIVIALMLSSGPGPNDGRRLDCLNNLRNIGHFMIMYADDHGGAYPDSFAELMRDGYTSDLHIYFCPFTKHALSGDFPAPPWKDADLQELRRIHDCGSYEMVKVLRHENRSDVIIACDKPGNHPRGSRSCFFDDGQCRWVSRSEFQSLMKKQEAPLRNE